MSHQQPLDFGAPHHPRARFNDPIGSHDAAASIERRGTAKADAQRCLNAVNRFPGRTTAELCKAARINIHIAGRRLPELANKNFIRKVLFSTTADPTDNTERCTVGGARAIRWWPL